ncbi:dihydropteroate synthase [candidate division KSB1 bacterium]|nr:dihydropteroate synthase [candidate division KSB1 bacterium]
MGTDPPRIWRHRFGELPLGGRTLLMGIVNVTPDSFSDGGQFVDAESAVAHALRLQSEGADLVDLGAESTRPGSSAVPPDVQLDRLLPVMRVLRDALRIPISIDTTRSEVARQTLSMGAAIINDVSGFGADSELAQVCGALGAGVVVMHMRGTPADMQRNTDYDDLIGEVRAGLSRSVGVGEAHGITPEHIVVDPGIGFGKSFEQNHLLIGQLRAFRGLGAGVLAGPSRKAFTAEFSGRLGGQRQFGTAAAVALCALRGADIIRVHDVAEMREVVQLIDRNREVTGGVGSRIQD